MVTQGNEGLVTQQRLCSPERGRLEAHSAGCIGPNHRALGLVTGLTAREGQCFSPVGWAPPLGQCEVVRFQC